MKTGKVLLSVIFLFIIHICAAQDVGTVIIRNGKDSYPKFIVSLNGVRLSNDYTNTVTYGFLDEYQYKINILQAGSKNSLTFMVYSAPNYISTWVINRDDYGNYLFTQESREINKDTSSSKITAIQNKTVSASATTGTVMEEEEYFDMIRTLKKEPNEKNRVEMAKTFFASKWLLASMVQDAIKIFTLDPSKVAFAKFAYGRTIDKQNYYKVFDSLKLTNSKKEMNEFIKMNP